MSAPTGEREGARPRGWLPASELRRGGYWACTVKGPCSNAIVAGCPECCTAGCALHLDQPHESGCSRAAAPAQPGEGERDVLDVLVKARQTEADFVARCREIMDQTGAREHAYCFGVLNDLILALLERRGGKGLSGKGGAA